MPLPKNGLSLCLPQWGLTPKTTNSQIGDCVYEHHFTILLSLLE